MSKLTCTVRYFDVSTGEASSFIFEEFKDIASIKQSRENGILVVTDGKKLLQIPDHKLIDITIG